ncbi:MAG TPA: M20/M25/M40 family metallo-hydrolase, partial [Propionibacteriaceae bacterium]
MSISRAVENGFPDLVDDLRQLVAIESVSADPGRFEQVDRSAQHVADLISAIGCPDVTIVREGGFPAVIARFPAPEGRPTVCLYAHHDVQPEGDRASWRSEPFRATQRAGRLYGRGAADDKGGIAVHLAALRAFGGRPPVGVTLFVEGEEEVGSPSLRRLIDAHRQELAADVYVIADSSNWAVGTPAFTTSLRGLADCLVELRTLDHALHSGAFGGVVPDALTSICRLLATLHDERGNVAVAGLHGGATGGPSTGSGNGTGSGEGTGSGNGTGSGEGTGSGDGPSTGSGNGTGSGEGTGPGEGNGSDLHYPEDRLRAETGILDGVSYLGDGTV